MKNIVDIDYIANYLKISKNTVYEMVRRGTIPSFKLDENKEKSPIRFDLDKVNEWIDKKQNNKVKRLF